MKIALFPFDAREANRTGNLARVAEAAEVAASAGARILVLPELWPCGYDLAAARRETDWQREIDAIAQLSREHSIAIVGSVLEPSPSGGRPRNCAIAHDLGIERARYRKVHLFGPLSEDRYIEAGNEVPAPFELAELRVAMAVCYDLRFPELFRPAAVAGLDLWCIVAQWPEARIGQWRALVVARAIESQCFVAAVNRRGLMGETMFGGNSLLVSPIGEILLDSGESEGCQVAEIDPQEARDLRGRFPVLGDCRWDLYRAWFRE